LPIAILLLSLSACGTPVAPEPDSNATTEAEDIPAGVLDAREAVLDFLRDGANECVPPRQAAWTTESIANPPAGYDVYRFHSGGCAMTITVPEESADEPVYHVALGDGATGFCWQAVVDERGQILLTGNAAQTDPTIGNPAQLYCEQEGYSFEVFTSEAGQLCGKCVFEDGRSCNAWAFFHGACTPETGQTP
jgi:putative hemolysin